MIWPGRKKNQYIFLKGKYTHFNLFLRIYLYFKNRTCIRLSSMADTDQIHAGEFWEPLNVLTEADKVRINSALGRAVVISRVGKDVDAGAETTPQYRFVQSSRSPQQKRPNPSKQPPNSATAGVDELGPSGQRDGGTQPRGKLQKQSSDRHVFTHTSPQRALHNNRTVHSLTKELPASLSPLWQ